MTELTYRNLEPALRERIAALMERREAERPAALAARAVVVHRIGWAAAGGAATLLGAAALLCGLTELLDSPDRAAFGAAACWALAGAWPAALLVGAAARWEASVRTSRTMKAPEASSADSAARLAALERTDPLHAMAALAQRVECVSAALPLAGLSLTAPLTLHWIVSPLFGVHPALTGDDGYAGWIAISALLVGHAHLTLLAMCVAWARSLRRRHAVEIRNEINGSWIKALVVTVAVSAFPGAILFAIPPFLVAITGLVFVPAMYLATARRIAKERDALQTALVQVA
jgi:hypothetical protein